MMDKEEKYGDVTLGILKDERLLMIKFPPEKKNHIDDAVIEALEKVFEEKKFGKLPNKVKEQFRNGEKINIKMLGNLSIKITANRRYVIASKDKNIVTTLRVNIQNKL